MPLTNDKLDKINYKLPPAWKIPFYEFVGGKIEIEEFEKILYGLTDLEKRIGIDTYVELISFNFSNGHIYNDVIKLILEKVLIEESDNNCKLFASVGEFYQNVDLKYIIANSKNLPEAVLNIFNGAHIAVKWSGVDNPAYDVEFLKEVIRLKEPIMGCLNILPSSTVIIGYAANSYMTLFMDDDGIVYISLDVTGEIYYGTSLIDALTKILLGLEYGKILCSPMAQE
ncbi:SUKH-3 domain-containing protein [Flavobacterium sp.]|uniref:SUKH-3 domain-containing protein n=1 Tax=Flavobacterium sp. TaxID=239 RepID=UPI003D10706D